MKETALDPFPSSHPSDSALAEFKSRNEQAYKTKLPGVKHDDGKDRMSLLPWKALRQVARVLTFGAKKYGANNWQGVEGERYEDAFLRHYESWRGGERFDEESGLPHLAHATCCLLFMLAQTEGLDGKRGS